MTENNNEPLPQPQPQPNYDNNIIPPSNSTFSSNQLTDSGITERVASRFTLFSNEPGIPEDTAIRLFNSVHRSLIRQTSGMDMAVSDVTNATNAPIGTNTTIGIGTNNVSWLSLTDQSDTCRICRYKRNDTELIECPCLCSGTMGFIHIKCLRRWIRLRNDNHCEICKESFNFPQDTKNYYRLFTAFFQPQYFGACIKIILNLITLTPLAYFTMNQLINTMDSFSDDQPVKILIIGPAMLLATSVYFLFYFEWALSCFIRLKNILKHWWNFGDQDDDDYSLIPDPESDIGLFDFDF